MKPLTRKEMLLDGAAKGNLDTFKPATREEVFAKRALANAGGSGGFKVYYDSFQEKLFANIETPDKVMTIAEARQLPIPCIVDILSKGQMSNFSTTIFAKAALDNRVLLYGLGVDEELGITAINIVVKDNANAPL